MVDEQHRFGVRQRAALEGAARADAAAGSAGGLPHTLHMTATPIPRTLALARYGDLDTSALRELPHGRQPIETRVVRGEEERAQAYAEVRAELAAGRQAYVVCPLIDELDEDGATGASSAPPPAGIGLRAATAELERLRRGELADYRWRCCTAACAHARSSRRWPRSPAAARTCSSPRP